MKETNNNTIESSTLNALPKTYTQYISQGNTISQHLENIEFACKAGCKWIQLRLKEVSLIDYLKAAQTARDICNQYEAVLIINDNIGIAVESGADGVHLGLTDTNPKEARKQMGNDAIIGGTANTLTDCLQHIEDGADYIGLGPFRFTTTKDKLSPTLGINGYIDIITELISKGFHLPIVGIGGITLADLPELSKTGLSNVAVSGLLTGEEVSVLRKRIQIIENSFE